MDTTHPYFHAIDDLQKKNVIEGYKDGTGNAWFKPLQAVSRAESLKIIFLATEKPLREVLADFSDVDQTQWYAKYVNAAAAEGMVQGYADGNFHPKAQVSRAEMIKMTLQAFDQLPEESDGEWYEPLLKKAKKFRLIDDANLSPHESLSRGEVSEIIYRTARVAAKNFQSPYVYSGTGKASFYGEGFHGRKTANGEIYDKNALTAAHRTLPFGTWLKVTFEDNYVTVRINDRGPYHKDRIIDLSEEAFRQLAPPSRGVLTVDFEVVNLPDEHRIDVPEAIPANIQTNAGNLTVPEVIVEQKKTSRRFWPYFLGSRSKIHPDFFENITLRNEIPQKVYTGSVFEVAGTTEDVGHDRATVFLQKIRPDKVISDEQTHFSGPISGRNFAFPVRFLNAGTYQMGLVLDNEVKSRVATIEVQNQDRAKPFPASDFSPISQIQTRILPEEKELHLSWNKSHQNIITKLVFSQNLEKKELLIEGHLNDVNLPFSFFENFSVDQNIALDLFLAESKDYRLETQKSNWKKAAFKNFLLVEAFPDAEKENITLTHFPRFRHDLSKISLFGKLHDAKTNLPEKAYLTLPNGTVAEVSLKTQGREFSLSLDPQTWGTHILEIISDQGEVLFNRGLYVYRNEVLPSVPWTQSQTSQTASSANVRYWTNKLRRNHGAGPVKADQDLENLAQQYAQQMAEDHFISHTSPSGRTFSQRLKAAGFGPGEYSENLSFGSTYALALEGLENSGSHRRNLLLSKWSRLGVGIAQNDQNEIYLVQLFGK